MIELEINKKLHGPEGTMNLQFEAKIEDGEFVTLYGPSGAGKTSVLRMLSGLLSPDGGRIVVEDSVWFDLKQNINLRPQLRNIGFVFQDYSLFPNMTVRGNLDFALKKGQSKAIVDDLLDLIELTQLHDKRPSQLSGGQKQRVALARTLVRRPKVLLLDEPLSALDMEMQSKLQDHILKVHREFGLTTLMISHDLIEVLKMSQRVLVMSHGRIVKDGKPTDVLPLGILKEMIEKGGL
jgi:molybdate transport system ATP-binding protein